MIDHTTENKFGKGITYAAPIDLNAKKPLDSRLYVDTIAERNAHFTNNRCYPGMAVYVAEDGLTYIFDGTKTENGDTVAEWVTLADRAWVLSQIAGGVGVTEARVREIIEEVLTAKEQSGELDDIKVYAYGPRSTYTVEVASVGELPAEGDSSILYNIRGTESYYKWKVDNYVAVVEADYNDYFPTTGIEGVQYIDKYQNIEYIWDATNSAYSIVNKIASRGEVTNLFD